MSAECRCIQAREAFRLATVEPMRTRDAVLGGVLTRYAIDWDAPSGNIAQQRAARDAAFDEACESYEQTMMAPRQAFNAAIAGCPEHGAEETK